MNGYVDIIFLALISVALIFKLISILGQKEDRMVKPGSVSPEAPIPQSPVIVLKNNLSPQEQLALLDKNYNEKVFLSNASEAFEMILSAYAQGQTQMLSGLLDIEMMKKFVYPITQREEKKQVCEINVLKVQSATISNVQINNTIADVTVDFTAEAVMKVTDQDNKVIQGSQDKVEKLTESWTFRKNMQLSDPTWRLVQVSAIPFA